MARLSDQRIAQRFDVPTTVVLWAPIKRPGKPIPARSMKDGAVVDVSAVGAGIVAPARKGFDLGAKVHVEWAGITGVATIRRVKPFRDTNDLLIHGIEFAESPSDLSRALHRALVRAPAERAAREAAARAEREAARLRAEQEIAPLNGGMLGAPPMEPGHPPLEFEGPTTVDRW